MQIVELQIVISLTWYFKPILCLKSFSNVLEVLGRATKSRITSESNVMNWIKYGTRMRLIWRKNYIMRLWGQSTCGNSLQSPLLVMVSGAVDQKNGFMDCLHSDIKFTMETEKNSHLPFWLLMSTGDPVVSWVMQFSRRWITHLYPNARLHYHTVNKLVVFDAQKQVHLQPGEPQGWIEFRTSSLQTKSAATSRYLVLLSTPESQTKAGGSFLCGLLAFCGELLTTI